MHPVDIIEQLAATNSRTHKEQIIRDAFLNDSHNFFLGVRLALDQLITFNIAKVAEVLEDDGTDNYTFSEFLDLADRLHKRALTGHAARDAIHDAANRCHVPTWNKFYRRILLKDLKVGVDAKTVNKVLQTLAAYDVRNYLIPIFGCQLAQDGEDPIHRKKLRGRKLVDMKLDGVRMLAVMDKDAAVISLFTRSGQIIENFMALHAALHCLLSKLPGSMVLDGELVSPRGFQHLMTLIRRKEPHDDMDIIQYAVFDILPLADFRTGYCAKPLHERHAVLEMMQQCGLWQETDGRIYVIPQVEVDLDTTAGQQAFSAYNQSVLDAGFEGTMVKDPDAPYQAKRTAAWLKVKPFISVSLELVALNEGDQDSKYRDMLGAFVCRGIDNGRRIEVNVGSGFSDDQRVDFWNRRDALLGMLVEIRADAMTLEQDGDIWSLRFPRFVGFRGVVSNEKI